MSRRFHTTGYFKIDFAAYVDDIFFHKLVSESYKPEKRLFSTVYLSDTYISFRFFFFFQFIFAISHLKE